MDHGWHQVALAVDLHAGAEIGIAGWSTSRGT
jgi:hypothetical protein